MRQNLLLILFSCLSSIIWGQVPQGIPYQAVARDAQGNPMANQSLSVQFSLHEATADGQVVYQETQTSSTNAQGLFSLIFGAGVPSVGTFASINWGSGYKFLQVQTNFGNGYVDLGTQQLMSVPYALFSGSSQTIISNSSLTIGQSYQGGKIFYLDKTGMHGLIIGDTIISSSGTLPFLRIGYVPHTSQSLFDGKTNFEFLISLTEYNIAPNDAFSLVNDLNYNGYGDWFIPSQYELFTAWKVLGNDYFYGQNENDPKYYNNYFSSTFFATMTGCATQDYWKVSRLCRNNPSVCFFVGNDKCGGSTPALVTYYQLKIVREF